MNSRVLADKRNPMERRRFGWRTVVYGFARSRRHDHRRSVDVDVVFLDRHHPWLFFLATGTMLLSSADAFLTLRLLELGMYEANPLMATVMNQGTALFISMKMAMTGAGVLTLVFLAKVRFIDRIRTGLFLTLFFSTYACLVCYEIVSLFRLL